MFTDAVDPLEVTCAAEDAPLAASCVALVVANILLIFVNVAAFFLLGCGVRHERCYDPTLKMLDDEQGEWHTEMLLGKELARVLKHKCEDVDSDENYADGGEGGEDGVEGEDDSDGAEDGADSDEDGDDGDGDGDEDGDDSDGDGDDDGDDSDGDGDDSDGDGDDSESDGDGSDGDEIDGDDSDDDDSDDDDDDDVDGGGEDGVEVGGAGGDGRDGSDDSRGGLGESGEGFREVFISFDDPRPGRPAEARAPPDWDWARLRSWVGDPEALDTPAAWVGEMGYVDGKRAVLRWYNLCPPPGDPAPRNDKENTHTLVKELGPEAKPVERSGEPTSQDSDSGSSTCGQDPEVPLEWGCDQSLEAVHATDWVVGEPSAYSASC